MRISAYVLGRVGIMHSGWVVYEVGQEYEYTLTGPLLSELSIKAGQFFFL